LRDFAGDPPKDRAASDVALTQARFKLLYDYAYDKAHGNHHGYRVDHVNVTSDSGSTASALDHNSNIASQFL
jgi:hypothetical protein